MEQMKTVTSLIALMAFLWFLPSVGRAQGGPPVAPVAEIRVHCDKGQTIQTAVNASTPGATILVSGTCNENVIVREEVNRITLDGQGTATLNGPDAATHTLDVRGRGITIRGFTITGGRSGIRVLRGTATITSSIIQGTAGFGVLLEQSASAGINGNTIQNIGTLDSLPPEAELGSA